jgi:hypothetical protein
MMRLFEPTTCVFSMPGTLANPTSRPTQVAEISILKVVRLGCAFCVPPTRYTSSVGALGFYEDGRDLHDATSGDLPKNDSVTGRPACAAAPSIPALQRLDIPPRGIVCRLEFINGARDAVPHVARAPFQLLLGFVG